MVLIMPKPNQPKQKVKKRSRAGRPLESQWDKHTGEPKYRNTNQEIFNLIPATSSITAAELKASAGKNGISTETLYAKLKDLEKANLINRWIDTTDRLPRVRYARREFFELGPLPTTNEEWEKVNQTRERLRAAIDYGHTLNFWDLVLTECEKQEPGKFAEPLKKIKSEASRWLQTDLSILALSAAVIMRRVSEVKNEAERKGIIKISSDVYIQPGLTEFASAPFFVSNPTVWNDVSQSIYDDILENTTEEKLLSAKQLIDEAGAAIEHSKKAKLIAGQFFAAKLAHLQELGEKARKELGMPPRAPQSRKEEAEKEGG